VKLPERHGTPISHPLTMEELEREHIQEILEKTGWRIRGRNGAAEILGLQPSTLYARMKKLGVRRPPYHPNTN
jgi:formate hydrogenlyase transcriptional activator